MTTEFIPLMALCEMCGKEARLVTAEVEGGELKVCSDCGKYGTVKKRVFVPRSTFQSRKFQKKEEPQFRIVNNYSSLIRSAREKRGISQNDFAKLLNERESIITKWENGSLRPRISTARKLERTLGIKLVERDDMTSGKIEKKGKKNEEFVLGDFVKVRKRK